jgi:hypothetical protein
VKTNSQGPIGTLGVTRRTVTRGLAWTAPVVLTAVTAPAYASSLPCQQGKALLTPGSDGLVTALTFPPSSVTALVAYSATDWLDQTPLATGQVRTTAFPAGEQWDYVKLQHEVGPTQGDTVTMTINFSVPVKKLSLRITDIDKATGEDGFTDEVIVRPANFEATHGPLIGTGQEGGFVATVDGDISSNDGDVRLFWPQELQQVEIILRAAENGSDLAGQHIGVGEIAFNNCP